MNNLRSEESDKNIEIEEEIDFEGLGFEVLEVEKILITNKEINFVFSQLINWSNFSDEDENDSRGQRSQRKHMTNKTQEVRVDKEFENDSENDKFI